MTINDNTFCVVDTSTGNLWDYAETHDGAVEKLWKAYEHAQESAKRWEEILTQYDTEQFRNYLKTELDRTFDIMTWSEYEVFERDRLLSGPLSEISDETFNEMLNVLPPLFWCTINGIELFCMSEMYTGSYTTQYAHDKTSNKFYSKMVDCKDKSTWIHNFLNK